MRKIGFLMLLTVFLIGVANSSAAKAAALEDLTVSTRGRMSRELRDMIKEIRLFNLNKKIEKLEQLEKDIRLVAEVIFWENWWTDPEKEAAYKTGAVVMNRVHGKNWPNTVHDVVYQKGQYSTTKYFYTKEIPQECYEMARDIVLHGTPDVPANVVYQARFEQGSGVWGDPINGEYFCYE